MSAWTRDEVAEVTAAVRRAPSVHNSQPWLLEFGDGGVSLFERLDLSLPYQDATGRDRLISCGTALTNLVLALRVLGRTAQTTLFPDQDRPDEVAWVAAGSGPPPSAVELARCAAIARRVSHRGPFTATAVSPELRAELTGAVTEGGAQARPITATAELAAVAELLTHAALVLRDDRGYQRELDAWTNTYSDRLPGGIPRRSRMHDTLPWAGLVRATTRVPHPSTLAGRLYRECLVLIETPDDGHRDHVLAGRAIQDSWLAATAAGLAGSVLTQPLQLGEVRAGLIERLSLAGFPQALLRFGHPVEAAAPGPRVPLSGLVRSDPDSGAP